MSIFNKKNCQPRQQEGFYTVVDKELKQSLPTLVNKFGEYLTDKNFITNPAIGREEELERLMLTLLTIDKSGLLIGNAGVGKTAIPEGLAYLIRKNEVPRDLLSCRIAKISLSLMEAGCNLVGMFPDRFNNFFDKAINTDTKTIIFFDEFHSAVGLGTGMKETNGFTNLVKPYLDRGRIQIIASTTTQEYKKYILPDEALKRRFEVIEILEAEGQMLIDILIQTLPKIVAETGISVVCKKEVLIKIMEFIKDITQIKNRTINDNQNNPDLALSILTKAFAVARYNERDWIELGDFDRAIKLCERLKKEIVNNAENSIFNLKNEGVTPDEFHSDEEELNISELKNNKFRYKG